MIREHRTTIQHAVSCEDFEMPVDMPGGDGWHLKGTDLQQGIFVVDPDTREVLQLAPAIVYYHWERTLKDELVPFVVNPAGAGVDPGSEDPEPRQHSQEDKQCASGVIAKGQMYQSPGSGPSNLCVRSTAGGTVEVRDVVQDEVTYYYRAGEDSRIETVSLGQFQYWIRIGLLTPRI